MKSVLPERSDDSADLSFPARSARPCTAELGVGSDGHHRGARRPSATALAQPPQLNATFGGQDNVEQRGCAVRRLGEVE